MSDDSREANVYWGIAMTSASMKNPELLWRDWDESAMPSYQQEPSRALLFSERAHAHAWLKKNLDKCMSRYRGNGWIFQVVRVTEQVTVEP